MNKNQFTDNILKWYHDNKRILPWRDEVSPYRVWVSEIMLQQTRVETVIPYFNRFIETLPTIYDLHSASDDLLNKLWEGLGYYSRVRNMKKAATKIIEDYEGVFPDTYDDILSLQGIGPYTAGAILSIAYNKPYSAVDGNVLRVFSRILGIKENIKDLKTKHIIKSSVEPLLPEDVSSFNQALMEIGATICIPNGAPKCQECPIQNDCIAYQKNLTNEIPKIIRNVNRKTENKTVIIIQYKDTYGIKKRPNKGLLANLYEFMLKDGHLSKEDISEELKIPINQVFLLEDSRHLFSHIKWIMKGYLVQVNHVVPGFDYYSAQEIKDHYSIPNAYKKYKKYIGVI